MVAMKAAVIEAPRTAGLAEIERPVPRAGQVLVRVEGCGVCGSSLPLWEGRNWFDYPCPPGAPGHEVWGTTEDGRRVATLSTNGFAEWAVALEHELVELPEGLDGLPFPGEGLACAVNVVRRARIHRGQTVAVVGTGFLGTTCARLCRLAGAEVTEVPRGGDVTGPFDRVIEAAGTQSSLDAASRLVAEGGLLAIAGYHQDGPRTVDMQRWNWLGIDVVNAHERDPRTYVQAMREAVRLTLSGRLDVRSLVTHRYSLDDLGRAFAAASERPGGFLKAVVCS
jgi:NADPH:quinone reductase